MRQVKCMLGMVALVAACVTDGEPPEDKPADSETGAIVDPIDPGTSDLTGTAAELAAIIREGLGHAEGYTDASDRARAAMIGLGMDGVALKATDDFVRATIDADLDEDGTRETPLFMTVSGERATMGATLNASVSQGSQPGDDLISMFCDMRIDMKALAVEAEDISGSFEGESASVFFSEGTFAYPILMGPDEGDVLGTVRYSAYDESFTDFLVGEMAAEAMADGGVRIRVTIDDDPETPDDETDSFVVQ